MPRPYRLSITPGAADPDAIVDDVTATGGTLSMSGALVAAGVATIDIPRHLAIQCTGNNSARTFTIAGTDRYGQTIEEAITGPNNATVVGTKNFKTVTSVSVNGALSGDVNVGTSDSFETAWWPTDHRGPNEFNIGIGAAPSGSNFPFKVQHTFDDVQAAGFVEGDAETFDHADFATGRKEADYNGSQQFPVTAMRLSVDSFTTGTLNFSLIQMG